MTPLRITQERNWLRFRLRGMAALVHSLENFTGQRVIHFDLDAAFAALDVAYQKKLDAARRSMLQHVITD